MIEQKTTNKQGTNTVVQQLDSFTDKPFTPGDKVDRNAVKTAAAVNWFMLLDARVHLK